LQVTNNTAYQGGGIYWDQKPTFLQEEEQVIYGNNAYQYGNQNASFATKLVKFYSTFEKGTGKILDGLQDSDYYSTYMNPNRI
jgi:hypothetical protein